MHVFEKTSFDLTILGLLKETSLAFSLVVTLKDKKTHGDGLAHNARFVSLRLERPQLFFNKEMIGAIWLISIISGGPKSISGGCLYVLGRFSSLVIGA